LIDFAKTFSHLPSHQIDLIISVFIFIFIEVDSLHSYAAFNK